MERINFKSGRIVYNEFFIDFTKTYLEQVDCLLEDLLQVEFPENYLLDVGWYPEYNSEGEFIVQVIKDYNWERPIYKRNCKNKETLTQSLKKAIGVIENIIGENK